MVLDTGIGAMGLVVLNTGIGAMGLVVLDAGEGVMGLVVLGTGGGQWTHRFLCSRRTDYVVRPSTGEEKRVFQEQVRKNWNPV